MTITATANFTSSAAMQTLDMLSKASGRAAIAEIVARLLPLSTGAAASPTASGQLPDLAGQSPSTGGNSASIRGLNSGAAIILRQLLASELASTNLFGANGGTASMELNLNQLLNSAVLQKALAQLPPELLARPQVFEALVLQNALLPANDAAAKNLPLLQLAGGGNSATDIATLYRVNVQWQNRVLQLLSSQPLPTGTRVPLQIDARGVIKLLAPALLSTGAAANVLLAQETASAQPTPGNATPTSTQTIQQSLRELLPRQQALHTLVPVLQKFITPEVRSQLPQPIFKAVAQLLQSLPKPAQLNTADNVKQAINNSGSFLEAKIAQAAASAPGAESLAKVAATDLKAQITALLALIRHYAPTSTAKTAGGAADADVDIEPDFVYSKPGVHLAQTQTGPTHDSDSLDSLLTQLGKLLQSGFARIQLNQLDSASARHVAHDSPLPVPTWVLELPLRTPHGVDQLQLRIEQHRKQSQQRARVQWNVEIAFDLHDAGKLAASLAIVDKSVAATLWAEKEHIHLRVREEMNVLRAGLESVGVNVTEMQCRHGLPPPRVHPISQQLVDVRT